jgi:hypothetical protein
LKQHFGKAGKAGELNLTGMRNDDKEYNQQGVEAEWNNWYNKNQPAVMATKETEQPKTKYTAKIKYRYTQIITTADRELQEARDTVEQRGSFKEMAAMDDNTNSHYFWHQG